MIGRLGGAMARDGVLRLGRLGSVLGIQSVPLGGVLANGWSPASGIIFYLFEAGVAVLLTVFLIVVYCRRRADGRLELGRKNVRAKDVLGFYGGSLLVMSVFFGGVVFMLVSKGAVPAPSWDEIARGLPWLAGFALISFGTDLVGLAARPATFVSRRVDQCMTRWGFLWLVGFVGPLLMMFTGRPAMFFAFFAGLKLLFEAWSVIGRASGWKSLADRQAEAQGS
jgi:hypothetical protein